MATTKFIVPEGVLPSHLGLIDQCKTDTSPFKVNGIIGLYADEEGRPYVMESVKRAEMEMAKDVLEGNLFHEYSTSTGIREYTNFAMEIALGQGSLAIREGRVCALQTTGCLGALRVAMESLCQQLHRTVIYFPQQTWFLHANIANKSGFEDIRYYRYVNVATNCDLDFEGLLDDLKKAPAKAVVVLQAVAHNPTGIDPNVKQWEKILQVVQERELFPLFDMAYQGLVSGDVDKDAFAPRLFEQAGMELMIATTGSKNFGLYSERTGALIIVSNNPDNVSSLETTVVKQVIRPGPGLSPIHGATVVIRILSDPVLKEQWKMELQAIADRLRTVRVKLRSLIEALNQKPNSWKHLTDQQGIFSFLGLSLEQCRYLIHEKRVYLYENSRINMAAINMNNVEYVAASIVEAERI
ncbi:aspartate aminotransferase, cytoplasmic-like [Tigriopus californicus]|uniref:Aspartate aminotransferase, mitochondrial n=2 Tax=Tigriopus californicus TaxID=6832 RepID=S5JU16_TIGCA|nr:aspartate aminotransferase, cytoplasmic-like [Tigriopus californicus]AGR04110.1 GOT1_6a [Tigriopus californicus]